MSVNRFITQMQYAKRSTIFLAVLTVTLILIYFMQPAKTTHAKKLKQHNRIDSPAGMQLKFNRKQEHQAKLVKDGYDKLPKDRVDAKEDDDLYEFGHSLGQVPATLTEVHKCPACFGTNVCDEVQYGDLRIHLPEVMDEKALKGVYFGRWTGRYVALKRLATDEEYRRFDDFICRDAREEVGCDVSKAILSPHSSAQQDYAFTPENLRKTSRLIHGNDDYLM